MRTVATAGALLASTLALAAPAPAHVGEAQIRTDLRPGDLIAAGGLGIVVGPPGTWTDAHATLLDGEHLGLSALTLEDGSVVVAGSPDGEEAPVDGLSGIDDIPLPQLDIGDSPTSPNPCEDGAYKLSKWTFSDGTRKSYKWKSTLNWWFRSGSTPSDVNADDATQSLRNAIQNITGAQNTCGLTDNVSATASYQGSTTSGVDFSSTGEQCKSYSAKDGKSVVAFGTLPPGWLGAACTWGTWNGTDTYATAKESDVRLNKPDFSWYAVKPLACSGRYSIEGVMTHERGHSFGLGHVSEADHGNLTMSTNNNGTCQDSESSLGLGDVRGLRVLY